MNGEQTNRHGGAKPPRHFMARATLTFKRMFGEHRIWRIVALGMHIELTHLRCALMKRACWASSRWTSWTACTPQGIFSRLKLSLGRLRSRAPRRHSTRAISAGPHT